MFILDIADNEESGSFAQAKRARLGELGKDTTRVANSVQPSSGQNFQSLQTFLKIL